MSPVALIWSAKYPGCLSNLDIDVILCTCSCQCQGDIFCKRSSSHWVISLIYLNYQKSHRYTAKLPCPSLVSCNSIILTNVCK